MVAARQKRIAEILGAGDGEVLVAPSRACRQRIRAFAGEDAKIHVAGATSTGGALAGGIRPGHASGINLLSARPRTRASSVSSIAMTRGCATG